MKTILFAVLLALQAASPTTVRGTLPDLEFQYPRELNLYRLTLPDMVWLHDFVPARNFLAGNTALPSKSFEISLIANKLPPYNSEAPRCPASTVVVDGHQTTKYVCQGINYNTIVVGIEREKLNYYFFLRSARDSDFRSNEAVFDQILASMKFRP